MEIEKIKIQNQTPPPPAKPAQEQEAATPATQALQGSGNTTPKKVVSDSVDISSAGVSGHPN